MAFKQNQNEKKYFLPFCVKYNVIWLDSYVLKEALKKPVGFIIYICI